MEIKLLTTITALHVRVGTRIAYTYSTVSDAGEIIRRNVRGSLVLTQDMADAAAAVKTLEDFLAAKLPQGEQAGVLTSFCVFQSTEGTMITYMYDEITTDGAVATKNNQATVALVEGYMDDQITAAATLRTYLNTKL